MRPDDVTRSDRAGDSPLGGADVGAGARRGPLVDIAVAAVVFLYNLPVQGIPSAPNPLLALLAPLALCLPYPWRRRYPIVVFALIMAAAFAHVALGVGVLVADVMLVGALAGLAARRPPTVSLPAAGVAVAWVVVLAVLYVDDNALALGDIALFVLLVVTAWISGQLTRTRRQYVAELHERARHLEREHEAQMRMAAADERARIAREIHDVVSHSLSAVTLLADGAATTVHDDPDRAQRAMLTVRDTSREAMGQMRSMLGVLRSQDAAELAPQPGAADIEGLVRAARDAGTPVHLDVAGDPERIPSDLQLTVYRVVQEALTNIRKHAGPGLTGVEAAVDYGVADGDRVRVRVADDGGSADPGGPTDLGPAQTVGAGHGLVGMRERVTAHGGTLQAGPTADGFEIAVDLPTRSSS